MRNPILMFRTALIATIGFFAVCSISHADPQGGSQCNSDQCKRMQQIMQEIGPQGRSAPKQDAGPKGVPAGTTSRGAAGRK
jgi:hypothetical protein